MPRNASLGQNADRVVAHTTCEEQVTIDFNGHREDIVAIADGYNMSIRTAVVAEPAADEAILREIERRSHNLVVMGVGRRPGEKLFFGDTAAALLEKSERSLLFVAT